MININKTYNKVKDVFVAPETSWYFGRWRRCPGLPVGRAGNGIKGRGKSRRLPIGLSFGVWNFDMIYKTKGTNTDFRYEFPPQFSIVAFGLCFVVLKGWPYKKESDEDSHHYGECILHYLYGEEPGTLLGVIKGTRKWTSYEAGKEPRTFYALQKAYLKPEYGEEYDKAVEQYELWKKTTNDEDTEE